MGKNYITSEVTVDLDDVLDGLNDEQLEEVFESVVERLGHERYLKLVIEDGRRPTLIEQLESLYWSLRDGNDERALAIAREIVCDRLGRVC